MTTTVPLTANATGPRSDQTLGLLDLPDMAELEGCIRCGLCLSVCPTYRPSRRETLSPRGRIALVKNMVEGGLALDDPGFHQHMNLCLQCMACHSVCPTGVSAGEVVARTKSYARANGVRTPLQRALRLLVYRGLFPHYRRMELVTWPLRMYSASGMQRAARRSRAVRLLPGALRRMEEILPSAVPTPLRSRLDPVTPAVGDERALVAFHLTCVNNVMLAPASAASVRVLARNGCRVLTPPGIACCGAPHETEGEMDLARALARRNIALYERSGAAFVVSDAAACGAAMKNYGHWLAQDPLWAGRARAFSAKVRDIHEYLLALGPRPPHGDLRYRVTYDDPCHLCHAQGISEAPRQLLRLIPGLDYVELREASWCCGSAGTYNITQPAMADTVLAEKMERVRETGARVVVSANPGCLLQLAAGMRRHHVSGRVAQVTELLDESYRKGDRAARWRGAR
jgi:glycolate oxidase iron-sulfur subunit